MAPAPDYGDENSALQAKIARLRSSSGVSTMSDETHHVNESADKITLTTKIKRGTGTRDQDEIKVKVKANDAAEAAEKLHRTVVAIGKKGTVNALRGTQPTEDTDD